MPYPHCRLESDCLTIESRALRLHIVSKGPERAASRLFFPCSGIYIDVLKNFSWFSEADPSTDQRALTMTGNRGNVGPDVYDAAATSLPF
jgi:hypothetical protein